MWSHVIYTVVKLIFLTHIIFLNFVSLVNHEQNHGHEQNHKAMSKIKDWSNHIVRPFWHCASECRKDDSTSDAEALRIMKV
jgi:hypothetical protein